MGKKAKWVLPVTVNPALTRCFQVKVPDDPQYVAAFYGAMFELARWYNWQEDSGHTAKQVADVMLDNYDQIAEVICGSAIFPLTCNYNFNIGSTSWVLQPNTPCAGLTLGTAPPPDWLDTGVYATCENTTYRGLYMYIDLPAGANFSSLELYLDFFIGLGGTSHNMGLFVFNGGSLVADWLVDYTTLGSGFNQTFRVDVPVPVPATRIYAQLLVNFQPGNVATSGHIRLFGAQLELTGVSACP